MYQLRAVHGQQIPMNAHLHYLCIGICRAVRAHKCMARRSELRNPLQCVFSEGISCAPHLPPWPVQSVVPSFLTLGIGHAVHERGNHRCSVRPWLAGWLEHAKTKNLFRT
ncbi:hypothetical protein M758_2G132100 [Ceratodon purpureus]|nr:hypothetical protein M758_2G132100 [Ceratodon purpureus]